MTAVLMRFRVQNFRSVKDSEWVDTNELTSLIGTNEAGKTNLLLPLWKLKPANGEPIDPLIDYPRIKYSQFKSSGDTSPFITADFDLDAVPMKQVKERFGIAEEYIKSVRFERYWNGKYSATFTNIASKEFKNEDLCTFFEHRLNDVIAIGEFEAAAQLIDLFKSIIKEIKKWKATDYSANMSEFIQQVKKIEIETDNKNKVNSILNLVERLLELLENNGKLYDEDFNLLYQFLPSFVYYSDYGNLNSEIYLPRVIEDLKRTDLKGIERDKARTLKVLFDFVNLTPEEILKLGREEDESQKKSRETIEAEAKRKKEREVLLHSASTDMTKEFKEWWKQGNYRFRFQADGNHFRIWVSDDLRPEEIELESRSRGLQWFFSFFLVFLVESADEHDSCILLLDEPGVTLHPTAQVDLINFFHSLSKDNQVIYTTHSPFLIDSSNLGKVKAVYVNEKGHSCVSADLRRGSKVLEKSVYPAHAAIGLSISETFLAGCQPVLVEGVSDQIYLHSIKVILVKNGKLQPQKELVFIPTGGIKGMKPIINIICGKDATLPVVILDSDEVGKAMVKKLQSELYQTDHSKILEVSKYSNLEVSEIEDIIPTEIIVKCIDRQLRASEYFADSYKKKHSILPQIEDFVAKNELSLENGWKVSLAKDVANQIAKENVSKLPLDNWTKLFSDILESANS